MSEAKREASPLVLGAVLFAVVVAASVWLRAPAGPLPGLAGRPAPSLEGLDRAGQPVALADFAGRVMFVNFWGTWCAPCREEAPSLERLYRELREEGFGIVAVSVDGPDAGPEIDAFREEFDLTFPILHDPEKAAYRAFGVTGVPETFVIDPEGVVVEHFKGPRNWEDPRFARTIRRLQRAGESRGS